MLTPTFVMYMTIVLLAMALLGGIALGVDALYGLWCLWRENATDKAKKAQWERIKRFEKIALGGDDWLKN